MTSRSCRPRPGHTYLTIGQDFFSIQQYIQDQYNASLHRTIQVAEKHDKRSVSEELTLQDVVPAAVMTYTDIHQLRGLLEPADYGSGVEFAKGLAETFPYSGLQIGLWLNGTAGCSDIIENRLQPQIRTLFYFLGYKIPITIPKVFLRVGYEFDNPWFGYSDSPTTYQLAFRMLVHACEDLLGASTCHNKIAFVWHSWAAPRTVESLESFYPGDDYVDWVGVSVFQQLYPWANHPSIGQHGNTGNFAGGNLRQVLDVLEFAHSRDKPIMIAESTPFGGTHVTSTEVAKEFLGNSEHNASGGDLLWDLWYQKVLDLISLYDIGMWSYINCNWDSQPMWHGTGFGDTRISSSELVTENWWGQILRNGTRFLNHLDCSGDVKEFPRHFFFVPLMYVIAPEVSGAGIEKYPFWGSFSDVSLVVGFVCSSFLALWYFHRRQQRIRQPRKAFYATSGGYNYGSI